MKTNGYRIFEKKASLRKRTRKGRNGNTALRILSAGLALSMLFTGCGPASVMPLTVPEGVEQVEAALQQDGGDSDALGSTDTVITGFADLPDEIREQTVSPGTTIEELNLPDTLEASVVEKDAENNVGGGVKPPADSEEPPAEEEKPDDGTEPPAEEEKPNDSTGTPTEEEKKPDDGTEPPTEEEKPSDGTETSGEDDNTDSVTEGSGEPSVTEFGDSENENTTISTDDEAPASSDTADDTAAVGFRIETGSFVMPVYAAENPQDGVNAGTLTDSTDGTTAAPADDTAAQTDTDTDPREKTVTLENITWQSDPSYDGDTEGVYTFTPVLPEGYVLAEGASLPEIKVTVDGTTALIQALLERIAALPDAQEYMAKEPDIDSWEGDEDDYEEAYTEWMEGLQEYAGEALAIWEEYEALTQEQQALFPQEALEKLAAWVEIAEQFSADSMVMAADTHMHNGKTFSAWGESRPTSGNYYLTKDVELARWNGMGINSSSTLNLCLNGKVISLEYDSASQNLFHISGGTLNLYDCDGSGGLSQHRSPFASSTTGSPNIIRINNGGKLNLYSGSIGGYDVIAEDSSTVTISDGTVNCSLKAQDSATVTISGGILKGYPYAVKATGDATVTIAGNATLRHPIYTVNSVIASGAGVSGLSETIEIEYIDVANGTVVVTGSTDTTHYQLDSDTYELVAKDGNLVAAEKTKIRSVTYNKNSGTIANESNYTRYVEGVGLTLPTPTRTGYTFGGWYTSSGFSGSPVTSISASDTGNKTYYAKWTANTYTVTYDTKGGTIKNESNYTSYTYGTGLTLPTPERTGYTFGGWYTDSGFSGSSVTSISNTETGNKTYYAKWTANSYTVTFDKNGGNTPSTASKSVTYGSTYGTLATVSRTGYTFAGWYTAATGGTQVTNSTTVTTAGNHTLYAHWTANSYTVTFDKNGGNTPSTANKSVTYDSTYGNLATVSRTGYTFAGWYTAANGGNKVESGTKVTTTGDHTLYAHWTAKSYTVTFDKNGGNTPSTASKSVTYGSTYGTLATVSRTGYSFAGWYTAATGGSKVESGTKVTTAGNHTLYAHWTANSYTVTFDKNGGNAPSKANQSVTYGSTYGTLATVSRTGYSFAGWYTAATGGSKVESGTKVTTAGNHTLYAHWTKDSYTITYTLNGGALPNGKNNPTSYTVEDSAFTLNNPEKTGYTFAGWSGTGLTGNSTNVTITKGSTGDRAFTANWTRNTYTISYTLNGGVLPGSQTNPTSYTVESSSITLNNPSKTGYTFAGWSGTGLSGNNTSVTIAKGSTGNRAFTANWTANKYTVTFDYQGATGGNSTANRNVTYDAAYGTLPAPEKTGYVFKGWYTQIEGRGSQITSTTTVNITDAQTLYAYWKDETAPAAPVLQSGFALPTDWTRTQTTIPLTLSDNVAVTELLVKIDNGNYVKVSGFMGGSQTVAYSYAVTEGNHTYHFKAKDAAGNISPESEAFTVMLDTGAPVFSADPAAENVTADSADITFTPSEGGKAYWIADPAGTPADAQAVVTGAQGSTDKGGANAVTGGTSAVIPVTGLTPGAAHKVYVVLEDAAGNLSVVKEAAFATLPEAPVIKLDDLIKDYEKEKIKVPDKFGEVEVYTNPDDPSGSIIPPGADGTLPVEPGKPIYIRYPEKTAEGGVTVRPSEGVKIDIPARPAAPAPKQVTVTDTTVTVKDASKDEEYILVEKGSLPEGAELDWNDAGQVSEKGEFTGLTPNKEYELYVRKKATDDDFASEPAKTEVRTSVTINEPEATGDGAGKPGNTAPKPEKPDEGGRTVTYTGTYGEEYTPVIKVGGNEIIPGAGTPSPEGSEMVWNEEDKKGEWKYVYPIPEGATEAEITVEFRKRSITGITAEPDSLTLSADDDANRSAAEAGEITPLTAYLKEKCGVKASYDNRTTGTPAADAITYTTSETFAPKGQTYPYTISAGGKTCTATLTVKPVIVSIRNPDALVKRQKEDGYTAQEAGTWLPAKLTVTYTGGDHTARTQELAVAWDTASIGTDFGKTLGEKTVNGTVELPAWATGTASVSIVIRFVDKTPLGDSQIRLTVQDFRYGDKKLPDAQGSVAVTDTAPAYTYLYSTDGGTTWVAEEDLPKSDGGYVVPSGYQVKLTYAGDNYTGEKTASFTVAKKQLDILPGTLAVGDKNHDGTTGAVLKEGGEAALSGIIAGDKVTLGGTLEARFAETGPKKNIPVTVTGFRLEGADSGYYELKNETLTLYATINNADGTSPSDGSGGRKPKPDDGKKPGNGGDDNGSDNGNGDDNGGGNGGSNGGNSGGMKPGDDKKPGDGKKPDDGTRPGDGKKPDDGTRLGDGKKPDDGTKPGDGTKPVSDNNGDGTRPGGNTGGDGDGSNPGEGETKIVSAVIEDGRIVIDGGSIVGGDGNTGGSGTGGEGADTGADTAGGNGAGGGKIATGNVPGMAGAGEGAQDGSGAAGSYTASTMLEVGEGAVIVRVVCDEPKLTAGVADTVAVANAVLTTEQIGLADGGDTIEIRVEVKDITTSVTGQDQEVIESAVTSLRKEQEGMVLGMYVDISMFVKIGDGDWSAVTATDEQIEVVIGVPEEMQADGRAYYVIRSHEGAYDILTDMDDKPDTITISTDKFSAYAIAYALTDGAGADGPAKCGLCHICPTFLGVCCFVWLVVIIAGVIVMIFVLRKRKGKDK